MTTQCCGTCRYYIRARNPETGRVTSSRRGECGWKPSLSPKWSAAYFDKCYYDIPDVPHITKFSMWRGEGTRCKTYIEGKPQ